MRRFPKFIPGFNLLLILIYSVISRFYAIGNIPQLLNTDIYSRYFTATLNIGSLILYYFILIKLNKSKKIALISAWVFMLMPWVLEQGRITSHVSNFLFILLLITAFIIKSHNFIIRSFLIFVLPVCLYIFYPDFWPFISIQLATFSSFMDNIFFLISPEFIFFKNTTFWWGGVKEFGILYMSFLPFFIIGLFKSARHLNIKIWIGMLFLIFITALSPYFPETQELFLATPVISIITAYGICGLYDKKVKINWILKIIQIVILSLVIYDLMQFNHYYYVHYPQNIKSNSINIHEPF